MPQRIRDVFHVLLLALLMAVADSPPAAAQERGEGPATLFLTYQCEPAKRAAFRAHMTDSGIAQFEQWKKEGVYQDYLVLFSAYVNATTFDMMVRLDFARYADTDRWRAIENSSPGGLSTEALALCAPTTAYLADLTWHGGPAPNRDLSKTSYLVIPYHFHVSKGVYKNYFATYVEPQLEGWLKEGAMSWWGVYLNQHNTGYPWDSLFLLEYADTAGLARRDVVKWGVRKKLQEDPGWKSISDTKQKFRSEDAVTIASPILPR